MWEIDYCSDLSGCWLERKFGRLMAHIGIAGHEGLSYYIAFCIDDDDNWFNVGNADSIEEAKDIAEAVAVQWIFDEHERGLSALGGE